MCVRVCVCVSCVRVCVCVCVCVTGFAKKGLVHTQFQVSLFTAIRQIQHFMLITLPKVQRSAFTEASFMGLSGIHQCLGGL